MPALIALVGRMLLWLVSTYAGQWVLKILVSLGLTVVTNKVAMPALLSLVQGYASALPAAAFQTFGALGLDVACSMILSATVTSVTGRMVLRRLAS